MIKAILGAITAAAIMLVAIVLYVHASGDLSNLGTFIGGISLFTSAIVILFEAQTVTAKNHRFEQYTSAVNSFRALYREFWGEPTNAEVRRWIISAVEYESSLLPVLTERNKDPSSSGNRLDARNNETLDKLDRFLASLVRIRSFSLSPEYTYISKAQQPLWTKILNREFWIHFIYKNREELWTYLYRHWKVDLLPKNAPEKYDPKIQLKF